VTIFTHLDIKDVLSSRVVVFGTVVFAKQIVEKSL
jgi:hypothetical protein